MRFAAVYSVACLALKAGDFGSARRPRQGEVRTVIPFETAFG